MWQCHVQAGKDRLRARIGDAQPAADQAPEAAPAASVAVGSAAQSGVASATAAPADAEHADDAGTPQRPARGQVRPTLPEDHVSDARMSSR